METKTVNDMEQSSSIPNYVPLPPKNPSISEQNPVSSDISYQNISPMNQSNVEESLSNLRNNNSVDNSANATIPLYSTSVYTPPSPPPPVFSNVNQSSSQSSAILPTMMAQSGVSVPVIPDQNLPFISPPVPQPQPIYCSDGIVYSNELEPDNDLTLPDNLVDIYRNLGIVGRILTGGSLVTIRFIQMFRNLSETLVDALGIARPKYEAEINAYTEMKQEEQQHQAEIQQMYGTWRPTNDPSNAFNQQPIISMNSEIIPQVPSNIQPTPTTPTLPPPPPPSNVNINYQISAPKP